MSEGDTLARIATVLRPLLVGRTIRSARARPGAVPRRVYWCPSCQPR